MLHKLSLYYHTIKYLKPVQIYWRLWRKVYKPKPDLREVPDLRVQKNEWALSPSYPETRRDKTVFTFLNEAHDLNDIGWDNPKISHLWRYNLHYFQDVDVGLVHRWIDENEPGKGVGWEPYPTSLRIVNWIKWVLQGHEASDKMLHSLAVQSRWMMKNLEYHILGNHLLSNAKALVFAGAFFDGEEAQQFLNKGLEILRAEILEQILKSGAHFELSPMYHAIILEDFLDLQNIAKAYDLELPDLPVSEMLRWLEKMCHPDGDISFFNDAAFGIALRPAQLQEYCDSLHGASLQSVGYMPETDDAQTDYIRIEQGDFSALLDCAPIGPDYLPGHAHADSLSFELCVGTERMFVNSGTSVYGLSKERHNQRSTKRHNTVVVDGHNSSEIWGGFRVARRARPFDLNINETPEEISVSCAHDGYHRLRDKPTHQRQWVISEQKFEIFDDVIGAHKEAVSYLHFHPDAAIEWRGNEGVCTLKGGQKLRIYISDGTGSLHSSYWYPEFGKSVDNHTLHVILNQGKAHVIFELL